MRAHSSLELAHNVEMINTNNNNRHTPLRTIKPIDDQPIRSKSINGQSTTKPHPGGVCMPCYATRRDAT